MMILFERNYTSLLRVWTLGQPSKRAERSGVIPSNPLGFSLNLLYPEMSVISIIELCIEPAKNLDSGVWYVRFSYMGELYDVIPFDTKAFDTKPLYYLIEYNGLDLLIAVKNKNIYDVRHLRFGRIVC